MKLHSQIEEKILGELLKEIYLYDCVSDNANELDNIGSGDVSRENSEIPVMKLYEAPSRVRSTKGNKNIELKKSKSTLELSVEQKKSNSIRRLSVD